MEEESQNTGDVSEIFKQPKKEAGKIPEAEAKGEAEIKPEVKPEPGKKPEAEPKPEEGGNKVITFILDLALNLLIVFGLVFIIQTFIASPFKVFGPSMCDTLNKVDEECLQGYGEYIIVNKLVYKDFFGWSIKDPQRGDIIVFHPPHTEEQFYIKRVIGEPGDTVKLIDGKVFIFNSEYPTGFELKEDYLNEENFNNTNPSVSNRETTFVVPEDKYFVLGDNREHSIDSRNCFRDGFHGDCRGTENFFLPRENIEGKAWIVLWPVGGIRVLDTGVYE